MRFSIGSAILLFLTFHVNVYALEPEEILVIANKDIAASQRIARRYCEKRGVPQANILSLRLGGDLNERIGREDYDRLLARPVRSALLARRDPGDIKCLLTTWGVPLKVGQRGPLAGQEGKLKELEAEAERQKQQIKTLEQDSAGDSDDLRQIKEKLARLRQEIARLDGRETNASVDSELSMVLFADYELYRWQPNTLKDDAAGVAFRTLMVSRLDGPDEATAGALVDKALAAEKNGLNGIAYIDSRGIVTRDAVGHYDQSLRALAMYINLRTELPVREERTARLFAPGSCPNTALYCGWYSLRNYVDAFDFVDGAVGYHISSFGAEHLRDPNSTNWCAAMLADGITATLGAVAEPYLHSFPEPVAFFRELFGGRCLVEAYYRTKPFNSWQLVLVGDPLYRPFRKP